MCGSRGAPTIPVVHTLDDGTTTTTSSPLTPPSALKPSFPRVAPTSTGSETPAPHLVVLPHGGAVRHQPHGLRLPGPPPAARLPGSPSRSARAGACLNRFPPSRLLEVASMTFGCASPCRARVGNRVLVAKSWGQEREVRVGTARRVCAICYCRSGSEVCAYGNCFRFGGWFGQAVEIEA